MLGFDNQVVLITGAGRGIGRQHALFFASRGAKVVVNDYGGDLRGENGNNPLPADEVVATIRASGGTAMTACCDIGDASQVDAMVAATIKEYGRLDIMIHNASVYAPLGSFAEARIEDLERLMRVNVTGGWLVAQAAWRRMVDQGYGRIVVTGSGAGFFGRRRDHAYSIAKSALMGLTKVLAAEGEAFGIKANLVGPIAFTENAKAQGILSIMEQYAPPIMVTNLVAVLAHEQCPVTGEMFHCGGGFVARVFVGETDGTVYTVDTMSPESVLADIGRIMDEAVYAIPATSDRSGAHLSAAIASVNPGFAQVLSEAKQGKH